MKNKILIYLFMGICFSLISCHKRNPSIPTKTVDQYGLPINAEFACLINGKPWIYQWHLGIFSGCTVNNKSFGIAVSKAQNSGNWELMRVFINTNIRNNKTDTIYNFSDTGLCEAVYNGIGTTIDSCYSGQSGYGGGFYAIAVNGNLTITKLDTTSHFISGTFWYNLLSPFCDTIRITEGRFNYGFSQ